jgi:UDP-hydrolysing UDP-N-acetyl-D-glucosamine 2-epimerase
MRKITVAIGSRANYASIKSTLSAIKASTELDLRIVAFASAVVSKYGRLLDQMKNDGFAPDFCLRTQIEDDSLQSMAESTGIALMRLPQALEKLQPDFVLTVGDRFETIATAIASTYMNIPLVHTMGGEVTGSIDESVRHAITKLSHLHFAATEISRNRIIRMGEDPNTVFLTGCPRIDLARQAKGIDSSTLAQTCSGYGVGDEIDFTAPFILVSQHPVTSEHDSAFDQMQKTLSVVSRSKLPTVVLWPNSDAGSEQISKSIRLWQSLGSNQPVHFFRNLPPEIYLKLMSITSCLLGNSSSGIREGSFLGTPVVNIGNRQAGREHANNVLFSDYREDDIFAALRKQIENGPYPSSSLYGYGEAGVNMCKLLEKTNIESTQKILSY